MEHSIEMNQKIPEGPGATAPQNPGVNGATGPSKEVRVRVPGMSEGLRRTSTPLIFQQTHFIYQGPFISYIAGPALPTINPGGLCRGNRDLCGSKGGLCRSKGGCVGVRGICVGVMGFCVGAREVCVGVKEVCVGVRGACVGVRVVMQIFGVFLDAREKCRDVWIHRWPGSAHGRRPALPNDPRWLTSITAFSPSPRTIASL
jgi:hypothetical protein